MAQQRKGIGGRRTLALLWLPLALGAIFVANLFAGRLALQEGVDIPHLKDSGEFLLLLATAAAFTRAALIADSIRERDSRTAKTGFRGEAPHASND